jgi:hypothetical protein
VSHITNVIRCMLCMSHYHSDDSATSARSGTALNNIPQRNYKSDWRPQICIHSFFFICMKLTDREEMRPHTDEATERNSSKFVIGSVIRMFCHL